MYVSELLYISVTSIPLYSGAATHFDVAVIIMQACEVTYSTAST